MNNYQICFLNGVRESFETTVSSQRALETPGRYTSWIFIKCCNCDAYNIKTDIFPREHWLVRVMIDSMVNELKPELKKDNSSLTVQLSYQNKIQTKMIKQKKHVTTDMNFHI